MSATKTTTTTETENETVLKTEPPRDELLLRLTRQPSTSTATSSRPHVAWTTDTVDNEHMDKKKSKCCCIYKKPRNWQDSSSDSDSDCETGHCRGHVEQRKKHDDHDHPQPDHAN